MTRSRCSQSSILTSQAIAQGESSVVAKCRSRFGPICMIIADLGDVNDIVADCDRGFAKATDAFGWKVIVGGQITTQEIFAIVAVQGVVVRLDEITNWFHCWLS